MQEENLNISYHVRILCIKALNKYDKIHEAAIALGITERTLFHKIKEYDIKHTKIYKHKRIYY